MRLIDRIFSPRARPCASDIAYHTAMGVSDELIQRMRDHSNSSDPARAVMADVWAQRRNVPFMATVFESVEEMKSGTVYSNGTHPPK